MKWLPHELPKKAPPSHALNSFVSPRRAIKTLAPWKKQPSLCPVDDQVELYWKTCGDDFNVHQELKQVAQAEEQILRQFYEKRRLLMTLYKKVTGQAREQGVARTVGTRNQELTPETIKPRLTIFSNNKTEPNSVKVIPIFSAGANTTAARQHSLEKKNTEEKEVAKAAEGKEAPQLQSLVQFIKPIVSLRVPTSAAQTQRFYTESMYMDPPYRCPPPGIPSPKREQAVVAPPPGLKVPSLQQICVTPRRYFREGTSSSEPPLRSENPSTPSSRRPFEDTYLQLQENKLDRQKLQLNKITHKMEQASLENRSVVVDRQTIRPQVHVRRLSSEKHARTHTYQDDTFDKHPLSEESVKRGAVDSEKVCSQFMYLLSESILLESHLELIRVGLQPHLKEVLRVLGAEGKTTLQKLTIRLSEIMLKGEKGSPQRSRRMEAEEILRKILPGLAYTNSSDILRIFSVHTGSRSLPIKAVSQPRAALRKFFTALSELLYFQESLKELACGNSTEIFNLVDSLHRGQQFSPSDLSEHLSANVHSQVSAESVMVYLGRRLRKGQNNGRFEKGKLMLWLMDR